MPVNFTPQTKDFLHDFTLIASVMGESVIGHGIGGKHIPAKMARLPESQSLEKATMVCRHVILSPLKTSDGSKIQVPRRHVL
jgi:hypothetical protein